MDVATRNFSGHQTERSKTVQELKDFNSQSLATRVKKGEQLVSMMPAIKKAFDFMGDVIVELPTKNETLKNIRWLWWIGDYDEKWLEDSKAKQLKQIDGDRRANLVMSRMQKQMKKHQINGLYKFYQNLRKWIS